MCSASKSPDQGSNSPRLCSEPLMFRIWNSFAGRQNCGNCWLPKLDGWGDGFERHDHRFSMASTREQVKSKCLQEKEASTAWAGTRCGRNKSANATTNGRAMHGRGMRRVARDLKLPPGRPDIVVLRTPPSHAARECNCSQNANTGERAGPLDPPGRRGEGRATRSPRMQGRGQGHSIPPELPT